MRCYRGHMSTEQDVEAKRKLFDKRVKVKHPTWKIAPAWIAELSPYRYAVWVSELNAVHVVFDANEIVALGVAASDDEWFAAFSRKLDQALAEEAIAKQPM